MATSSSRTSQTRTAAHLTRRDFFHDVAESLRGSLPEPLREFQVWIGAENFKLSYGRPRLHYEIWTNGRDRHIEVGLHFEDGPESTERLLRFFDARIVEIKHELGPEIELERWTNSWGHLFRLFPYQPLTDELTAEVSQELTRMICLLQPLLDEAVPPRRATSAIRPAQT
ncbi:MAG TPA: hypothetical protein VHA53_07475 [Nitrolancea sp.]|jgi:hypothetical protein|nr:hypothetical protein [Nitrolancea sp.]